MDGEILVTIVLTVIIMAGVAVLWIAMHNRRLVRELEHRERLAMIERGLVPPPELDPAVFERQTAVPTVAEPQARSRSAGIIMIGLGLGLMVLIAFAAEAPSVGVGIGGAFALLGAAFVVNSFMGGRRAASRDERFTTANRTLARPLDPPARTNDSTDSTRNAAS